jgi:protein-disulfide isomerase
VKRRRALAIACGLFGLALGACHGRASDDAAFGERVRAYLLKHPEVLQEASERLDAKLAEADAANRRRALAELPSLRTAIERDPRDFVANPGGSLTVTEFYDYRCPHCVSAAPKVVELIKAHPDVRFVFKEMPIFGPASEHAALAALAVKRAGGDYMGMYSDYMATRPLDETAIEHIARKRGATPADLTASAGPDGKAQLARNAALFSKLALEGTPAFIVGDKIILGEDMASVNAAIAIERARDLGDQKRRDRPT